MAFFTSVPVKLKLFCFLWLNSNLVKLNPGAGADGEENSSVDSDCIVGCIGKKCDDKTMMIFTSSSLFWRFLAHLFPLIISPRRSKLCLPVIDRHECSEYRCFTHYTTTGLKIDSRLTMAFPGRECVLPEEELKRRGTEELGEQGGGRGNVLGQNLKNGGGRRRVGGQAEAEEAMGAVTGGTEFPSYTPLRRTGSGRNPGELHCNLI